MRDPYTGVPITPDSLNLGYTRRPNPGEWASSDTTDERLTMLEDANAARAALKGDPRNRGNSHNPRRKVGRGDLGL